MRSIPVLVAENRGTDPNLAKFGGRDSIPPVAPFVHVHVLRPNEREGLRVLGLCEKLGYAVFGPSQRGAAFFPLRKFRADARHRAELWRLAMRPRQLLQRKCSRSAMAGKPRRRVA